MSTDLKDRHVHLPSLLATFVLAGVAGGIAEVAWAGLYSAFSPLGSTAVLREIVASFSPTIATSPAVPALGMAIHFVLAVLLAIGYGWLIWMPLKRRGGVAFTMLA